MHKIIRNAIRCTRCGAVIESEHVHDFKWCPCQSCAVDGGKSYLRRCWRGEKCFEELSVTEEFEDAEEVSDGKEANVF